jgi:hypothetical protein
VALRDAMNEASVKAVGERLDLIDSTRKIIELLRIPPGQPRTPAARELNRALIAYLGSQNQLATALNDASFETIVAAEKATVQWERLKRRLRC